MSELPRLLLTRVACRERLFGPSLLSGSSRSTGDVIRGGEGEGEGGGSWRSRGRGGKSWQEKRRRKSNHARFADDSANYVVVVFGQPGVLLDEKTNTARNSSQDLQLNKGGC